MLIMENNNSLISTLMRTSGEQQANLRNRSYKATENQVWKGVESSIKTEHKGDEGIG